MPERTEDKVRETPELSYPIEQADSYGKKWGLVQGKRLIFGKIRAFAKLNFRSIKTILYE